LPFFFFLEILPTAAPVILFLLQSPDA